MSYLTEQEILKMGFKSIGKNVQISDKASIYDCDKIKIGKNSRIDDFCVISGEIEIGQNVHITPMCLVAGGELGLIIDDFATLAYGVKVFTQSDDYSGKTMANSTVPKSFKNEIKQLLVIGKHSIVGAGSIIMPGASLAEGSSIGANSLVIKPTKAWSIFAGSPAKKIKDRKKDIVELERLYLINEA